MELESFEIEGIDPLPEEGFLRGNVVATFTDNRFGDGMPVHSKVNIGCFIAHDGGSTLETIEAEFLREARRLLSGASSLFEAQDAPSIRRQAKASRDAKDARRQAEIDAELDRQFGGAT